MVLAALSYNGGKHHVVIVSAHCHELVGPTRPDMTLDVYRT